MKYEIKKDKSNVTLKIEVEHAEMLKHKTKACEDFAQDLKIPGFRPGKAPMNVVEQHIDPRHILAHTYELAVQYSYAEAAIKEKLQVVSQPKINFISDSTKDFTDESMKSETFKFEAEVAVLPEVTLKDYKSIKIPEPELKVEQKEIDETISEMKKYFKTWTDVEREVKKGDRVEVDFEGFDPKDEMKPVPNTASKNHPVIVGEGTLIPGFEDNMIGLKKDEKKEFTLTFPADYHKKDFQNKKIIFKIEVKRIEEGIEPELTEELVEKVTGKKMTIEEFKKDIEKSIGEKKEHDASHDRENKFLEALLKESEIEIPQAMTDEEIDYMVEDVKADMEGKGIQFDKFLEQTKMTQEELRKKYKPEAEKRVKLRLTITKVIELEKIEVTEDELNAEIEKMSAYYPKESLQKHDEKNRIKNRILLAKFFEKMLGGSHHAH